MNALAVRLMPEVEQPEVAAVGLGKEKTGSFRAPSSLFALLFSRAALFGCASAYRRRRRGEHNVRYRCRELKFRKP